MKRVALVGSRGYVGQEMEKLLRQHPELALALSVSARDGLEPRQVADAEVDAWLLALPNGASGPYLDAIGARGVVVDLSADHRFDDAWTYGQPERRRDRIASARRLANPGCYATAMQLGLAPLVALVDGPPSVFGVSGYSGTDTTPSPKNDPEVLRDNLLPYALTEHVHEREVSRQLGCRLFFMPHVAPFFRGITCTISVSFATPQTHASLWARYEDAYGAEPLVVTSPEPPLVRDIAGKHHVAIGGLTVSKDGRHAVVVATIDNLLGGAATQALRNLNLALGLPERTGL